jgi:DNA-binding HxlR family transcriptional regulator
MKDSASCPVTTALSVIGGKWKVIILWHLQGKVRRFGELQKAITGISQKMLTQELRDLEESGLVRRKIYPVVPPKVEYSLTEFGKTLTPVMEQLCAWGKAFERHTAEAATLTEALTRPMAHQPVLEAVPA